METKEYLYYDMYYYIIQYCREYSDVLCLVSKTFNNIISRSIENYNFLKSIEEIIKEGWFNIVMILITEDPLHVYKKTIIKYLCAYKRYRISKLIIIGKFNRYFFCNADCVKYFTYYSCRFGNKELLKVIIEKYGKLKKSCCINGYSKGGFITEVKNYIEDTELCNNKTSLPNIKRILRYSLKGRKYDIVFYLLDKKLVNIKYVICVLSVLNKIHLYLEFFGLYKDKYNIDLINECNNIAIYEDYNFFQLIKTLEYAKDDLDLDWRQIDFLEFIKLLYYVTKIFIYIKGTTALKVALDKCKKARIFNNDNMANYILAISFLLRHQKMKLVTILIDASPYKNLIAILKEMYSFCGRDYRAISRS